VSALPGPTALTRIDVACQSADAGWACTVTVTDERGTSTHGVRVAARDLERLAPGAATPDDLVRRSFEFLLAREGRASILGSFDLPLIGRYFPDYEATIIRADV
jgi:hypothetical protein